MVAREEVATPRWAAKYRLTGGRIAGGYLLVGPREGGDLRWNRISPRVIMTPLV